MIDEKILIDKLNHMVAHIKKERLSFRCGAMVYFLTGLIEFIKELAIEEEK